MKPYRLDIDDFCEEVFPFLESINESGHGHECVINAIDKNRAARIIACALEDFIASRLKQK